MQSKEACTARCCVVKRGSGHDSMQHPELQPPSVPNPLCGYMLRHTPQAAPTTPSTPWPESHIPFAWQDVASALSQ